MPTHNDILHTLQHAAQKRARDTQARKAAKSQTLGATGYHRMQKHLNKKRFLAPIDSRSTRVNIYYMRRKFMRYSRSYESDMKTYVLTILRFCHENRHGDWKKAIHRRYCDKGLIMTFLHWICEAYFLPRRKRSKRKTIYQYWRDFKMLYRRTNKGKVVNENDCEEIRKVSSQLSSSDVYMRRHTDRA